MEIIIFESILPTFEATVIFWGNYGRSGNRLKSRIKPQWQILTKLSLSKSLIYTVPDDIDKLNLILWFYLSLKPISSTLPAALKMSLDSKVVKIDSKIIILIR